MRSRAKGVLLALSICLAVGAGWAISQERGAPAGRVPKPVIAPAQGEKCVEPAEFMRRNHMEVLLRQIGRAHV